VGLNECENLVSTVTDPSRESARVQRPDALFFKIGDLVTTPRESDWIGEVVDVSRLGNGFVTVRWRTTSGTALQSMEERLDLLVLLPAI